MGGKYRVCFYVIFSFFLLSFPLTTAAITIDELADICKKMESSIVDISIEYEWRYETALSMEDQLEEAAERDILWDTGYTTCKLSAARSLSGKDPNSPVFDRIYLESSTTFIDPNNEDVWDGTTKISYDGEVTRHFTLDERAKSAPDATIAKGEEFEDYIVSLKLSPVGFSVFRQGIRHPDDTMLLADILREKKEFAHLDNTITKVNGFNVICVSLLTEVEPEKQIVYCRIYFSVDHGYTPVGYEFMAGKRLAFAFDVISLEEVSEGLWFPSSGVISSPDEESKNSYRTISKILVNQGLADKDFKIEFPAGTRVYDKIIDRDYVVKAE